MSTFEGPLLSIKSVNALAHYTDWIVGHVHSGALGWNGFLGFGMLYYLVPRLWRTELYSVRLATYHFWIGLSGIVLYVVSMWAAGITQGLMLADINPDGRLTYPDFIETLVQIIPLYWVRAFGGLLFITGHFLMIYNLFKTVKLSGNKVVDEETSHKKEIIKKSSSWHRNLEALPVTMSVLAVLGIMIGSVLEILPTFYANSFVPKTVETMPYTALELQGRDIYIREGCYNCHSQMIRPFVAESLRYGKPTELTESIYNRPFQWGSKRTGPDLQRLGGKYPDMWHFNHMLDPRSTSPQSIMPNYGWLAENKIKYDTLPRKIRVMTALGVPYPENYDQKAIQAAQAQARIIAEGLQRDGGIKKDYSDYEITALIAYMQRLGKILTDDPYLNKQEAKND
jgi:cytochrome c oxidase cbb3-type subunit I/II